MYTVHWRGIILTAILPALIQLKHDFATTDISDKMKALLSIAASVQKSVKDVTLEQPDRLIKVAYDSISNFESGNSRGTLTRRDTASWKDKSWVIGVTVNNESKAYDWNNLQKKRVINDKLGNNNIALVLSKDNNSFFAYEKPTSDPLVVLNDTLLYNNSRFKIDGRGIDNSSSLKRVPAYQEFWHSWRTFHKNTKR